MIVNNCIEIISESYVKLNDKCIKLEEPTIHLGGHNLLFSKIINIDIKHYDSGSYIETWGLYFDICDQLSHINGEDINIKYKLVIQFDSWYKDSNLLKGALYRILSRYALNNINVVINCFNLRRYFL